MHVAVGLLMAAYFASCTGGSETYSIGNGSAEDLIERFGTGKLKVTDLKGAKIMNMERAHISNPQSERNFSPQASPVRFVLCM
jgi:hypothetical protein